MPTGDLTVSFLTGYTRFSSTYGFDHLLFLPNPAMQGEDTKHFHELIADQVVGLGDANGNFASRLAFAIVIFCLTHQITLLPLLSKDS